MANFTTLKANARRDLDDIGVKHFPAADINAVAQDAYDDIVAYTQCIIKKTTLNWVGDLSYYDFKTLGVSDFLSCLAIYNNVNRRWLFDDKTIRHFDGMRWDWELANGTPENWAALNFKYTAVFPKYKTSSGNFDLYYAATAPVIVDASTPLIATDFQKLITNYIIGSLLEEIEEFTKANDYWIKYYADREEYRERVKNIAKSDLLMVV